jgi:polysaccharide biosynthesis protein PslJ
MTMLSKVPAQRGHHRTARLTRPLPPVSAGRRGIDAVTLLSCYLLLLMAIPSSLVVGSFGAAGQPAALFAAALLCWYLLGRQHPGFSLDAGPQPVRRSAIWFGCAVIASYVSANRMGMSALESNGADRGLISLAGWLGVLLLAVDGIGRADRLAVLFRRIVLGATVMAVLGMIEFFTGIVLTNYISIPGLALHDQVTDLMTRAGLVRANATAAQPLEFAAVMAMSLPLAVHQARFAAGGLRLRRWLQVALIAGAIPMAVSRSAILGLVVIAVVLVPWPVLVWLIRPGILAGFGAIFSQLGSDTSSTSRTGALTSAVPIIAQHPWLGQGLSTFFPQSFFFVDDQYLTSLIETGVIGLLAVLALFATGLFAARSARRHCADPAARDLAQCLTAVVVVAALAFATFDVLSFSIASGLYFLLLGCTGAAWRLTREADVMTDSRSSAAGHRQASAPSTSRPATAGSSPLAR